MNIQSILIFAEIIVSISLIAAVLMQNRGAGLGQSFGGDSAVYHTKRGLEKRLHQATIILSVAFLTLAVLQLIF